MFWLLDWVLFSVVQINTCDETDILLLSRILLRDNNGLIGQPNKCNQSSNNHKLKRWGSSESYEFKIKSIIKEKFRISIITSSKEVKKSCNPN